MFTPEGYLGGDNWCGVITDLKSLRRTRRLRTWIKESPLHELEIKTENVHVLDRLFFIAPPLLFNKEMSVIYPDISDMKTWSNPHFSALSASITYQWQTQQPISKKQYLDSEDVIGQPLD